LKATNTSAPEPREPASPRGVSSFWTVGTVPSWKPAAGRGTPPPPPPPPQPTRRPPPPGARAGETTERIDHRCVGDGCAMSYLLASAGADCNSPRGGPRLLVGNGGGDPRL